jgi:hypothetical protein
MSKGLSNYGDSLFVPTDWLSEHLDGPFLRDSGNVIGTKEFAQLQRFLGGLESRRKAY